MHHASGGLQHHFLRVVARSVVEIAPFMETRLTRELPVARAVVGDDQGHDGAECRGEVPKCGHGSNDHVVA